MESSSAILYQNPSRTVTLIDIPASISQAQGTAGQPCSNKIYSKPALEVPYPSTEPKTEKAKANVVEKGLNLLPDVPIDLLEQALREISAAHYGRWCADRHVCPSPRDSTSRPQSSISFSERGPTISVPVTRQWSVTEPLLLSSSLSSRTSIPSSHISNRLVHNTTSQSTFLDVRAGNQDYSYIIPPNAAFILSKITAASMASFSMAALCHLPPASAASSSSSVLASPIREGAGAGQFDFILLDPPWPNRSARRSKDYRTIRRRTSSRRHQETDNDNDDADPIAALKSGLGPHVAPQGIVACWITNSPTSRAEALDAFDVWGLDLVEEWCWLKVTVDGRPVTILDGIWRKPYEILLVGRKMIDGCVDKVDGDMEKVEVDVQRRIVVAVPDSHSRKPNVKELMEGSWLEGRKSYRALEIFARSLTAGWWALGDEVLKFQWEGWWMRTTATRNS